MAIIPQKQLFRWNEVEELGDLERLKLVIDYLPDEELMQALEDERGNGRNDYPDFLLSKYPLTGWNISSKALGSL
jgi:hypothetical protein